MGYLLALKLKSILALLIYYSTSIILIETFSVDLIERSEGLTLFNAFLKFTQN